MWVVEMCSFSNPYKRKYEIDNALCEKDCLKYWEELIYTQVTQVSKHRPKLVVQIEMHNMYLEKL